MRVFVAIFAFLAFCLVASVGYQYSENALNGAGRQHVREVDHMKFEFEQREREIERQNAEEITYIHIAAFKRMGPR